MPPKVASIILIEKNFRRLLNSAEEQLRDQTIQDWKLNQFVNSLTSILNDMRKSISRPSSKQLDEYKQRIDLLREQIDPIKLDEQTFPRQQLLQKEATVKEQQSTPTAPPAAAKSTTSPSESEGSPRQPRRTERPHLNRIQQHVQSEEEKQNDIAEAMRVSTRSLKQSAQRLHDVVKDDQKKLVEAENLIDTNTAKLHVQSRRLKQNAYNGSNCWIYLMLIVVILTFIYLTLFMRMFRKRRITTTTTNSNLGSKSSLLANAINQTSINQTNSSTATQSTDYISLLLNYANENHTDL